MTQSLQRPLPLTASTGKLAELTGLLGTTLRRMAKADQTFPQPFVINDRGDLRWPVAEVVAWFEARAGRSLAA